MKLFFLTHHKCASGWFNKINFDLFRAFGRVVYILNDNDRKFESLNQFYASKNAGLAAFNNADPNFIDFNDDFKAVHIVRDPRDIIVSAYYSHKKQHRIPDSEEGRAIQAHREKLNKLSLEEGLIEEIAFSKKWYLEKQHNLGKIKSDKILRLKLEDISKDYVNAYRNILSFYGIDIVDDSIPGFVLDRFYNFATPLVRRKYIPSLKPRDEITKSCFEKIMASKSWEAMSGGRKKGEVNINSHYRKGVPGDWKNYFTPEISKVFNENFTDIVETLGYDPE